MGGDGGRGQLAPRGPRPPTVAGPVAAVYPRPRSLRPPVARTLRLGLAAALAAWAGCAQGLDWTECQTDDDCDARAGDGGALYAYEVWGIDPSGPKFITLM